jgi:DNA-directed RNA polymerase subunit N (RpoN/RPB10)
MNVFINIMALYRIPMIECSSCGQCIGHLFEDYYDLSKRLIDELKDNEIPNSDYTVTSTSDDIRPFLKTYYIWYSNLTDDEKLNVPVHSPANVVARALLRLEELKTSDLPFGSAREDDNQISAFEARICCLRMFMSDPGATII